MKSFLLTLSLFPISAKVTAAQEIVKIEITCNDQMMFNTKKFEVNVGDKVALTLKNTGKIPLKTMGHNLVILHPGTPLAVFAGKAAADKKEALPQEPEMRKFIFANTRRLGGGESHTIHFIPKIAGEFPFICTTPGHFSQMQGVMSVKEKD